MKVFKPLVLLVLGMLFVSQAFARFETHDFATPQIEQDYNVLVAELRCLVCQNQNLADSNAELAQDMRLKVYKLLSEGNTREQVVDYMVTRYGAFVMYRPPVNPATFLLWFGPLIFFVIAAIVVVSHIRRKNIVEENVVDNKQHKKAHSLLEDE